MPELRPLRRPEDPPRPRSWRVRAARTPYEHLADRFFLSLRSGAPAQERLAWARGALTDTEWSLFARLPDFDQRHAVGVGRFVSERTGDPVAVRAALLHDVGKLDCSLGPVGRAAATLVRRLLPATAEHWSRGLWEQVRADPAGRVRPRRWRDRFAVYWLHPWIGRRVLTAAGAEPAVAAWAEHHQHLYVPDDLAFPWETAVVLWEADND